MNNTRKNLVVIHGCYNTTNFGDLLLLDLLSQEMQSRLGIQPICPWVHKSQVNNIHAVAGNGLRDCLGARIAVFGGGGYLVNNSGNVNKRLIRYTAPALIWQMAKVPYAIVGVGAGPRLTKLDGPLVRSLCNGAQHISVRDEGSAEVLCSVGVPIEKIEVTADIALSLSAEKIPELAYKKAAILLPPKEKNCRRIGIHLESLIFDKHKFVDIARRLGGIFNRHKDICPVWLVDHAEGLEASLKEIIHSYMENAIILPKINHWVLAAIIGQLDAVITTKLHVGIVAWSLGVPPCGYSNHPKTKRFYEQIHRVDFHANQSDPSGIIEEWVKIFINTPSKFYTDDYENRQRLARLAERNYQIVEDMLKRL